jgi:RNA recognition motif-containing protein
MESTESAAGSFSYAGSSGFASFGSLGLVEDDGLDRAEGSARPPISPTMFANYNQYGLWDSITGDLFSSSSRDSDVHHARQRSAEALNLEGLHLRDDAEPVGRGRAQWNKQNQNTNHGMRLNMNRGGGFGREASSSPECSPATGCLPSPAVSSPVQVGVGGAVGAVDKVGAVGAVDAVDKVKRTVYVADVHYLVSEQELARFFSRCGPLVDFRICGDTNTVLRFAFVEFHSVKSAKAALKLTGSRLGESTIRVSQSKTAIIPVKDQFLPRSERERDLVAKTVYVANIHPTVERDVLKQFFQMVCGPVSKIRLLGDAQHDTKIAFVEFASKDSTAAALRCTGAMLGPLAIRVSPSKTPVRTDARRRSGVAEQHLPIDAATAAAKLSGQIRSSLSMYDAVDRGASDGGVRMRKDGHLGARGATHAGPTVEGQVQLHLGSGYANGIENGTGDLKKKKKSHPPRRRKRSDKLPDPGVTGASPTIMSLLESILRDEA